MQSRGSVGSELYKNEINMRLLFFLIIPMFCFSQEDNYDQLKKLPKVEFEKAVNDSIERLESLDLWNFLKALKDDYSTDLKPFNISFIQKMKISKWPLDMRFLLTLLIDQKTDPIVISNILNERKEIWDKGLWAEQFWRVIKENELNVKEGLYYTVNENGQKKYNINLLLEEKIKNNELGPNPLLFLDNDIKSYPENRLIETLENLNIIGVEIISKEEGPTRFGKSGIGGGIKILTNKTNL